MIYFTLISRVNDCLPLSASIQEDEELSRSIGNFQSQAKQLIKKLDQNSLSRCSITSGSYIFHYIFENGVCFLTLTALQFNRTKAFGFLEDIQKEFLRSYQSQIFSATRPYAFIEFERYIQKSQKVYTDSRSSSNVTQLNVALQDVQRIMVQNIDNVLQRGETLSSLDARASNLSTMSKKYQKDAHTLNMQSVYAKYTLLCIVIIVVFGFIYFRFLW